MQLLFKRLGLGLAVMGLLFAGGCRATSTDRMRVLEAEKSDLQSQNQDLKGQLAGTRARELQMQAEVDKERARADAAEAKLKAAIRLAPRETGLEGTRGVQITPRDGGGANIILSSDVTFKAGRADLSKGAVQILRKVAAHVKATENVRAVRVEGHTDSDPIRKSGWKSNEDLSLARARMVLQYLLNNGISEDYLSVQGYGAQKPRASNKTKDGKSKNRRVVIVVLTK